MNCFNDENKASEIDFYIERDEHLNTKLCVAWT
jgi:hypothetical protein